MKRRFVNGPVFLLVLKEASNVAKDLWLDLEITSSF